MTRHVLNIGYGVVGGEESEGWRRRRTALRILDWERQWAKSGEFGFQESGEFGFSPLAPLKDYLFIQIRSFRIRFECFCIAVMQQLIIAVIKQSTDR